MTATIDPTVARELAADREKIRAADPRRYDLLASILTEAVPAEIEALRDLTDQQRDARGAWQRVLGLVAAKGDVLLYGGAPGEAATVFARLAETLALLAYADGGVTVFGLHWHAAPHEFCPGVTTSDDLPEGSGLR